MRPAIILLLAGCAAPITRPAPRPLEEVRALVFLSAAELGPLAQKLPPNLDLKNHVLVLPGGWLPSHADRVQVIDVSKGQRTRAGVHNFDGTSPEWVAAEIVDQTLRISFVHDINESGYCCSGIAIPTGGQCHYRIPPPMPERADPSRPLVVTLLLVPKALERIIVTRGLEETCMRP